MRYQAYSSYKQLDHHWLDKIPTHWIDSKVKFEALFQVGWTPPTSKDENFIGDNLWANISDLKTKTITNTVKRISDEAAQKASMEITPVGSLLYSFKLSVGARAFAKVDLYTNEAIASFLPQDKNNLNYLYYAFGEYIIKNAAENIYGAKILNQDLIKNAFIALPEIEEQAQIAAFLDRETAVIDTLIAKQEELIGLLKEKRTAVISTAVTKGINPHAPLKDSGTKWLGQIPSHWEVRKTKRIFRLITEPAPVNNNLELLSVYTEIGVKPRRQLEARGNKASTTDGYWMVKKGDIIVNKLLAWMGAVGYSAYEGVTSPAYDILRPIQNLNPKFYHYLFRNKIAQTEFKRWSRGIMEMRLRLYFDELGRILMPYPPLEEQNQIVLHIEKMDTKFDVIIDKATHNIELLKERRTALISAAVTGKIDVRGA